MTALALSANFAVLKVIENQKTRAQNFDDETDMVDAFVACGGRIDKTGHVKRYDLQIYYLKYDNCSSTRTVVFRLGYRSY